jgi:Trk K+ transport system NAD-binding subunit
MLGLGMDKSTLRCVRTLLNRIGTLRLSVIVWVVVVIAYGVLEWLLGASPQSAAYAAFQAVQWNLATVPEWPQSDSNLVTVAWLLRFAVPIAFAGVVAETLARFDFLPKKWFMRRHVIIVGAGDLGTSLAKLMHDEYLKGERGPVVVIERSSDSKGAQALKAQNIWVITGCGTGLDALQRAQFHRAERILVVTGDDFVNCSVAMLIAREDRRPRGPRIDLLVADASLRSTFLKWSVSRGNVLNRGLPFSSYEITANHIAERVAAVEADAVSILGFGKLGQAVLAKILTGENPAKVRVLERECSKLKAFQSITAGIESCEFHQSDLSEQGALDVSCIESSIVIVCTDSEVRNLDILLRLAADNARHPALVVLRNYSSTEQTVLAPGGEASPSLRVEPFTIAEAVWKDPDLGLNRPS